MRDLSSFSLWCDFVEREFLVGEFRAMIEKGEIKGATSNPAIFASAILNSPAYKKSIEKLRGLSAKEIYENLAFSDIKSAATSLLPLWERNKNDGFISIEIDPMLCDEAGKSIDEGRRIFERINMPNVMIKVPATEAGYEVMSALYADKININATLVFSTSQAQKCLNALGTSDNDSEITPKAVISVFVSRFDRFIDGAESSANKVDSATFLVDSALSTQETNSSIADEFLGLCEASNADKTNGLSRKRADALPKKSLRDDEFAPKLGIYNAMKCYKIIENFSNPHIRTLFASTGVKGGALPASYYVTNLLLPNTINTAPLGTIKDFVAQKCEFVEVPKNIDEFLANFETEKIAQKLLNDGLEAFKIEFEKLLKSI